MLEEMTGKDILALRSARGLSARKLGEALGVDAKTVLAWEREEMFPTKRHTEALLALLQEPVFKQEEQPRTGQQNDRDQPSEVLDLSHGGAESPRTGGWPQRASRRAGSHPST